MTNDEAWPALPLAQWRATCDTLHMYAQVAGKIRLELSPGEPQWAHVAMYVSPHGLTTGPIPYAARTFQIEFDFVEHRVDVVVSDGQSRSIALAPRSVADFYAWLMQALRDLGIDVRVWPMPVTRRRSYQFPAGFSMWSITNVSTGPFAGSNFRPSSSWSAANIESVGSDAGELPSAGSVGRRGENLVPSRENSMRISNRPAIPVLSNTGRPKIAKSILEKSSSVVP